jgi:hypothetical protein
MGGGEEREREKRHPTSPLKARGYGGLALACLPFDAQGKQDAGATGRRCDGPSKNSAEKGIARPRPGIEKLAGGIWIFSGRAGCWLKGSAAEDFLIEEFAEFGDPGQAA